MLIRLRPLFDRYPKLFRPTAIEPVGGSGLSGAEIFRTSSPLGRFALRCWPSEHPTDERLRSIHRLLTQAHERGCNFVPIPIASLSGETFIEFAGRRWQLERWMPGEPEPSGSPSRKRVSSALDALARLHRALDADTDHKHSVGPSPGLAERVRVLESCLNGDLHRVRSALADASHSDWHDRAERYSQLFERSAPAFFTLLHRTAQIEYRLQPVVRDVHREHVLFTGNEVTGLIDFGAMSVDNPAVDLARLLGSYDIDDAEERSALLIDYSPNLLSDELSAVEAFDRSGALLSPFRWLWWLFVERRTFRDMAAVAHRFDVLLQRLTRLVDDPPSAPAFNPTDL